MSVSPADFALYSRVTGTPIPRTPAERMRLAPTVQNFIRQQGYAQQGNFLQDLAGNLLKVGAIGAAGLGAATLAGAAAGRSPGSVIGGKVLRNYGEEGTVASPPQPQNPPSGGGSGVQVIDLGSSQLGGSSVVDQNPLGDRISFSGPIDENSPYISRPVSTPSESSSVVTNQTKTVRDARQLNNKIIDQRTETQAEALSGSTNPLTEQTDSFVNQYQPALPEGQQGGDLTISGSQQGGLNLFSNVGFRNPLANDGQVVVAEPVQKRVDGEIRVVTPKAMFRRDVNLGIPAPRRPGMKNLGTNLSNIWGRPYLLGGGGEHHRGLLESAGGALTNLVGDVVAPEIMVPLRVARMAGGALGNVGHFADVGLRGIETAGTVGAAVGQQALGDVIDTGRIFAGPVAKVLRQGAEDVGTYVPQYYRDYAKPTVDRAANYVVQRAVDDTGKVVEYVKDRAAVDTQVVKTAAGQFLADASQKLLTGSEYQGYDHPDVAPGEVSQAPNQNMHIDQEVVDQEANLRRNAGTIPPDQIPAIAQQIVDDRRAKKADMISRYTDRVTQADGESFVDKSDVWDDRTPQGPATYLVPDKQNGSSTRGFKGVGYDPETENLTTYMKVSPGREEVEGTGVRGYETPNVTREKGEELTSGAERSFDQPEEERSKHRSSLRAAMQRKEDTKDK